MLGYLRDLEKAQSKGPGAAGMSVGRATEPRGQRWRAFKAT